MSAALEPDRDQIEIFVNAVFRYAGSKGFVAVRSFCLSDQFLQCDVEIDLDVGVERLDLA
jgi:hypothetical protein